MERNNNKVRVFFKKLSRLFWGPVIRFRKFTRKWNMNLIKIIIAVSVTFVFIAFVGSLFRLRRNVRKPISTMSPREAYWLGTPISHVALDEVYKEINSNTNHNNTHNDYVIDDEQQAPVGMVETFGCNIPVAVIDYEKYIVNSTKTKNDMCGVRAVFIRKHDDDKVIARIKMQIMSKYAMNGGNIQCCYRFIVDAIHYPRDRPRLMFSNCTYFQDTTIITLQSDFINVICSEISINGTKQIIYDDMYAFTKKINFTKANQTKCNDQYNVLILGMDSMSLPRIVKTMPRTAAYLNDDHWLGFRGYHKVADNSLPNIMAALTGKNMSSIIQKCHGSMDACNRYLIWKAFKNDGYVTAYGEDNLKIANTFIKDYAFRRAPTDHYMRPFFLKGENNRRNKTSVCTGKISSGQQLLDYALDFANTYKKDSFFGFFWINSFSYDEKSRPEEADKLIENFLNQLSYTGIMANTFIIFLSDHGLRFGNHRLKMEGFYDDRMPMHFMWVPFIFKGKNSYEFRALAINQHRLFTPYDMYSTLLDIKRISLCSNSSDPAPEGCRNCHSLFSEISSNRTCEDADIHKKWCTCHKLYPLATNDPIGIKSVNVVVDYIKRMTVTIATQRCWSCKVPSLKHIHRIHFYYNFNADNSEIYYVIAITLTPGNATYEATVMKKNDYSIVGPLSFISYYKGLGQCALNRQDRLFCVCQKTENC
ncbi:unnamed protein product [Spodoptera littoralis]|uniref:Uncharacterized protein n=1 Tax=Spodoptera littoralis TaxID=7109 RepID=A0A9P0IG00_SPOLI|nr:unnamed protein product [Spodoptera littoralis]CAH1646185.1 unnamed protein product [Spodoptera littoralis]